MNQSLNENTFEVGFDVPALVGMADSEVQTPSLIVDLDALERNIREDGRFCQGSRDASPSAWKNAQVR